MFHLRRVALQVVILVLLLASAQAFASRAGAGAEWCDTDPLVLIRTPHGALVPVFVNTGAQGVLHQPAVLLASMTYTVSPAPGGGTLVHLSVVVPDDLIASSFPTRTVASTGPLGTGRIYHSSYGVSGEAMMLVFTLGIP